MTEFPSALGQASADEEATALRAEADRMNALANDPSLIALAEIESAFYREIRYGYLDAQRTLQDAADRIGGK
ncbi:MULTISPECIES: hypothetical protein [Brevibacterium]|uniref:Uncharacterized protein n=1 Tax=Brevibacterium antiquum CNRZ 918 TaxID=1255637 RepID=A0A2H1J360_9MICO|nr:MULTISPECIES: hypothetical protein [Brevibacterium]SMX81811.1 hypothetical protein BANT918_01376 [Brevibacterium antiquum CNRZ 918]HCG56423.1 hypothetical protein [Brevibacterium sp.]